MKYLLALGLMALSATLFAGPIPKHLQAVSVTVDVGDGSGSGVVVNRKVGDKDISFVLTAAHVVDGLRDEHEGQVSFREAEVVQEVREGGHLAYTVRAAAKVVFFDNHRTGDDLALLRVIGYKFKESTSFYLDKEVPEVGTEVYHVGSWLGYDGSHSLSAGIISQHGRQIADEGEAKDYDQVSCTCFPGSSGGGCFLKEDGRCIGLIVRWHGQETWGYLLPIRRMKEAVQRGQVEWVLDPSLPVPTLEELEALPIERTAVK